MSPDTLHRIAYDSTVDDAVDVGFRMVGRTQAFRKQIRLNIIIAGVLSGALFAGAWIYYTAAPSTADFVVAAAAAIAFGLICAAIFKRQFSKEMRTQQRKIVAEQFGGKPTIACETELRSDALVSRQAGMELTFPWTLCTGVSDNAGDVQIDFSTGICVVRNRQFPSAADRQAFLETARRLAGDSA